MQDGHQENQVGKIESANKISGDDFTKKIKFGVGQEESGLLLLNVWAPFCKLYRKTVIGDCRFEEYKVAEDLLFNTKVICSGRLQKVVFIEYPFYHYMINEGSAMQQKFQKKYLLL